MSESSDWDDSGRHRHGASAKDLRRIGLIGGKFTVAALSFLLLLMTGWGYYNFSALNRHANTVAITGLGPDPTLNGGGSTQGGSTGGSGQTTPTVTGSAQNILIVGVDSRAGLTAKQESYLKVGHVSGTMSTDTIMLVHVPADGSKATLISIPRDSWVHIPGHPDAKINAAYADGYLFGGVHGVKAQEGKGASTLVATVKQLTGVPIDHYVQVGFEGFEQIVKAIGTIPINLCQSVNDTRAYNASQGLVAGSGFKMAAGHHNLTPQQALEFVRQRHNIPGPISDDFGRELRQRYFLDQAFNKILSAGVLFNPVKLHNLVNAIDAAFTFDQNGFDIVKFAEQMTNLTAGNIVGRSIPTQGNIVVDGQDALKVDPAQVTKVVQAAFSATHTGGGHSHSSGHSAKKSAGVTNPAKKGCVY